MEAFNFLQPENIPELYKFLDEYPSAAIIAGGTDVLPKIHNGLLKPETIIDISLVDELNFIEEDEGWIQIGALNTFTRIIDHPALQRFIPALVQASRLIGAPMTRARGTLGGNIANASPAADTLPPLLVYDTRIRLSSSKGERKMQLRDFLLGPGSTNLKSNEVIHSISFPKPDGNWGSAFIKIGPRRGMTISIANIAAFVQLSVEKYIQKARIALGAVAPTAIRCPKTEPYFEGKRPDDIYWQAASSICFSEISPIDDIRGSKTYRLHISNVLLKRVFLTSVEIADQRFSK
ncbi:MAG: xanthine dehydrogenase family protein subunit M [Anaerolineaceae bacterium]|nr:xanthine dehydrogenase family protein subunit M [Anaerolineaceae bacterium]